MNDLEGLMIYKQYVELIDYTLMILKKYPKSERYSLVNDIKNSTYNGIRKIIIANKEYNKSKRIIVLNDMDNELKLLKVLIRVSYKQRYINNKNYSSWSKKITNINNLLFGWIKACLKV